MGNPVFILGDTGTGKTTSLENLDPAECMLIKVVNKPLSFGGKKWTKFGKDTPNGSVVVSDKPDTICKVIKGTKRKIIIVDDFQYIMANAFMNGVDRTYAGGEAFQRFNVIAKDIFDVMHSALDADEDKIIYFLAHTEESPNGKIKVKTIGKLLDEKVVLEGLCTIVLRSIVTNGIYEFSTKNNGNDTCKSPKGMFEKERIPNDLKLVTETINEFYGFN